MRKLLTKTLGRAAVLVAVCAAPAMAQTIGSFGPSTVAAGGAQFTLTVNGSNLTGVLFIDWTDPGTTAPVVIFVNQGGTDASFTVTIPAARIAAAGNATVAACVSSGPVCGANATFPIRATPVLTSLSQTSAVAGAAGFALTLTGTNFTSADQVSFGGTIFPATVGGGGTTLTANITAAAIANSGDYAVLSVDSAAGAQSNSIPFTVGIQLTSLSPASTLAGSGTPATVSINAIGGLGGNTQYFWNGTTALFQSGSPSATNAQVQIPANLIALPGSGTITAVNGKETSNGLTFTASAPVTTSISPTSTTVGAGNVALTINGTNFGVPTFGNAQVIVGGATTVAPTTNTGSVITVTIPYTVLGAAGPVSIAVQNFGSVTSNAQTLTVYALPVVTSVAPATIPYNTATPITVNGTFNAGDRIVFNGTPLATTGTTTQLQATAPATQNLGQAAVQAINPAGATSTTTATVNVIPVISTLSPASVAAGSGQFTLTVNVTGGLLPSSPVTVNFNGNPISAAFVSATQVTALIPANLVLTAGPAPVTLTTLGETSAPVNFTVSAAAGPTVTSVTPNQAAAGSAALVVNIAGTNFVPDQLQTNFIGSRVLFTPPNGSTAVQLVPTSATANLITVTIPPAQLAVAGTASIAVMNVTHGTTSGSLPFTILRQPVLSSIFPNGVGAGATTAINAFGSNFAVGDAILVEAPGCEGSSCLTTLNTTFDSSGNVSASLLGTLIPVPGTYYIYVGTPQGVLSQPIPLTVGLAITSLTPSLVGQNVSPVPTLVVQAVGGMTAATIVYFNGQPLSTVFDSSTQLHATLTAADVAVAGTYPVTVQAPGSPVSNALNFTVSAAGIVTAINPTSAFAGTGPVTIQVSGSNFNSTDVVQFGATPLVTTFVNAQSLTATVPAALLTNATSYAVTVIDTSSNVSNGLNFQVTLEITSLSPPSVAAGGPAFNLTANLDGGVTQNSVLYYNGLPVPTVSFTANSITGLVPANRIATVSTPPVWIMDGSTQSNTVNHMVLGLVTLTSISPTAVDAGTAGLLLTLNGVGFNSTSVVSVNGTAVPTTLVNSGQLTAQITANLLASPGTAQVLVTNSQTLSSNALPLSILTPLSLTSLNPAAIGAGSPQFSLTVNGAGFGMSTVVTWFDGESTTSLTTTYLSPTQVMAIVPAPLVAQVGTAQVGVVDGGRTSPNTLTFTIGTPITITNLNPGSALTGAAVNLTIMGTGFSTPGVAPSPVTVYFGTNSISVTPVSPTTINVNIPSAFNSTPGLIPVTVVTGSGLVSNALTFTSSANPIITYISPSGVSQGQTGLLLTVGGSYFQPGSVIVLSGTPLATTYVSQLLLTATLPVFPVGGNQTVSVVNPGGLSSNTVILTVGGATATSAILSSISPATVVAGGPAFTLTAIGSGFLSGATIHFGGTALGTSFLSSSQLSATVPAGLITQAGAVTVNVVNPDGTSTNSLALVVTGNPVIISLSPVSISAGAPGFSLGVSGGGFKTGAVVTFGGTGVATTFVNSGQLTASIPASLVRTAGQVSVTVTNPDMTASGAATFNVNPFSLNSINPASAAPGSAAFTMTLTGVGFLNGASVSFNGTSLSAAFVDSTKLTVTIPANLIATAGIAPVTVTNPDGAVAGPSNFAIQASLTIVSVNPTTIPANSKATTITVTGTGFVQGTTIVVNGTQIPTTFVSPTSLTGTVPASLLTQQGPLQVTVTNPNGSSSNPFGLTVGPPLPPPAISSVSPATAVAGAAATPITITGSGFVQGSSAQIAGGGLSTQFVSATQLTGLLSAAQLAQAGVFPIQVVNPDGQQSNSVSFTVLAPLSITSLSPASVSQGAGDTAVTITGVGIVSGATVLVGSTSLAGNASGTTSISATIPAAQFASAGPLSVTVKNPDGTVSNALTFNVVPIPVINLSATITPAGTNQVTITVSSPAPADLTGTLTLSFVASASNAPSNYIDPALQFAAGGTSITFTIPKGSTTATLPGNGAFSPGTVAGTLTLTLTALKSGTDNVLANPAPSKSFTIAPAAPSITTGAVKIINGTSAGFTVELTGFSTTREIKTATLTFTSSQTLTGGNTATVDVTSVFNTYFASASGIANGGTFKLDIPFTISGADASVVTAVSVTLTNSIGTSAPVSGGR